MQALLAPLKELAEYGSMREAMERQAGSAERDAGGQTLNRILALTGCVDAQKLHMIYGLSDGLR